MQHGHFDFKIIQIMMFLSLKIDKLFMLILKDLMQEKQSL